MSCLDGTSVIKNEEKRVRMLYRGNQVFNMLAKRFGKEIMVKSADKGVNFHYSLFGDASGLSSHIKIERAKGKPLYVQKRTVSMAEFLQMFGVVIAPDGDPPPDILLNANDDKLAEFSRWFERVKPRVLHTPTTRRVVVPTGRGMELIEELLGLERRLRSSSDKQEIDITEMASRLGQDPGREDATIVIREDEMAASGHTVAFSEDESRLIFLLSDNTVMEASPQAIEGISRALFHKMGLPGFFKLMRNKGLIRQSI